jgi:hypothetical protein
MQGNSKKWQQADLILMKIIMKYVRSRAYSTFCLILTGLFFHFLFNPGDEGD